MIGKTISHYKILEKLGAGGMGIVYKAEDTNLKRTVAIKFLPPNLTWNEEAKKRFIHEARATSVLEHNNICNIHEIDETEDGQTFIVMACYEGETLKDKIKDQKLKIKEAVDIAGQIAQGLAKAHAKGIVHRDIKPANIFITNEGVVKILDFGLAKLAGPTQLTKTDTTLGTVSYMSPEQTRGEKVDNRTDIWSLGVVLYELLTGQLPFKGEYGQAVVYSILNEEPKKPSSVRKEIPSHLEQIVIKALEKDPDKRFQNMHEMIAELKIPLSSKIGSDKREKSIIVLPFVNMSPDPDQEYFSDGLTEEIITDLSNIYDLLVISRSSAMTLKGTSKTIPEIARSVNVTYVLEGSVRKAGNSLRITAQLIDAERDVHLWADKFTGTLDDVFDIQEKVSKSIADALRINLGSEEKKKLTEKPIDNVFAYDCYLQARREVMSFSKDRLLNAIHLFKKGLDIVGENAVIYAGMAFAYFQYANIGIEQEENIRQAEAFIEKVYKIDSDLAEAHFVQGCMKMSFQGNIYGAIDHFQKAHSKRPYDPEIMQFLSFGYDLVGKTAEATSLIQGCIELDPLNPLNYAMKGVNHFFQGRFEIALKPLLETQKIFPESNMLNFWISLVFVYNNRYNESLDFIDKYVKEPGQDLFGQMCIFLKHILKGDKKKLSSLLYSDFVESVKKDCQYSWHMATFYSFIDDKDQSFYWLENAVERGFINYPFISEQDKLLNNIRGEQRFMKLMERVKHEWENFEV